MKMAEEKKQKILVVEDDLFLRDLYCELLQDEGFYVDSASDGPEGFVKMKKGGWDLILLDIVLPKMDGLEIMRRIKNDPPKIPNGPVVFLTNLGKDEPIKEGFRLGAVGYLIKSQFTPDQVLSEIKNFLTKSKKS
jgi:CheY-like chemotaxis protein